MKIIAKDGGVVNGFAMVDLEYVISAGTLSMPLADATRLLDRLRATDVEVIDLTPPTAPAEAL